MSMRQSKVFLDSSVIISALASRTGNSLKVLALAELGIIVPCISEGVVGEVLEIIQKKLPACVDGYYALFKALPFKVVDATGEDLEYAGSLINEKAAPILAAAISGKVDWLLTLDRRFLNGDWKGRVSFKVSTPGDFLQELVPFLKGDDEQ